MTASHRPTRHDEWGQRPCVTCHQAKDLNPAHGSDAFPHHDYDPGERRHLVRRMEDRVRRVEEAAHGA